MIAELQPTEHLRVYDLVREAGLDVSHWANYQRPESPATNPKFCYNWAFEGTDQLVLCLWFGEMRQDEEGVYQVQNYRVAGMDHQNRTQKQRERAQMVDHAIQLAKNKRLPIRVIVVDGSRRNRDEDGASRVQRRILDPVSWFVAAYDDDGNCRLQRNERTSLKKIAPSDAAAGNARLARISYNSAGWTHPTGDAGDQESGETYNAQNRFGHEDWLFRTEWLIDGWRYAFIQGLNKSRRVYFGRPLDVTLFTILPGKRRKLVATIYGLETLDDEQARAALDAFRNRGWLQTMQDEVVAVGGNPDALGAAKWAEHVLNVRFRRENVEMHPPDAFLPEDEWTSNRHRYMLYEIEDQRLGRIESSWFGRRGTQEAPTPQRLFRRGTKALEYTPEHQRMQSQLFTELQEEYGDQVCLEQDFVDVRVETGRELIYYEIKTDLSPRAVIRQALGQILEYAYHPARSGRRPDKLVIVGRCKLTPDDDTYLRTLCETFHLPLGYRVVPV